MIEMRYDMTDELTEQSVETEYCETILMGHGISPMLQGFIEDMNAAICHVDNCEYKMDQCHHRRLAHELIRAMIDYHAALLEQKDQKAAASILRSEM